MTDSYEALASLLEYPEGAWSLRIANAAGIGNESLHNFKAAVESLSLTDLQELYARTFDLNPTCALEIGYHLFGENYKRGEFLAHLRETEAPFDLGQQHQLPDYLPVLLRLLPRLEDEELRGSLITECLIPGIEKMLASFQDTANLYTDLLQAVRQTLQSESGLTQFEPRRTCSPRASLPVLPIEQMDRSHGAF